jgi:hypothetical protein
VVRAARGRNSSLLRQALQILIDDLAQRVAPADRTPLAVSLRVPRRRRQR